MTEDLRQQAIQRIRAKRGFWLHLGIYLAVNTLLVVIWALTSAESFWPVWPILGWGIGIVAHALTIYARPSHISAEQIDREMRRQA